MHKRKRGIRSSARELVDEQAKKLRKQKRPYAVGPAVITFPGWMVIPLLWGAMEMLRMPAFQTCKEYIIETQKLYKKGKD